MSDLISEKLTRMVDTIDIEVSPITLEELERMAEVEAAPKRARRFSGPAVAFAGAAAVVVLIVGFALVTGLFEPEAVSDTVPPPTTEVAPSTTVGATTTSPAPEASGPVAWAQVEWARVPDDSGVFGGEGLRSIEAVVAGGPGLVAVGTECTSHCAPYLGPPPDGVDNRDAAIWVSPDGVKWSRVAHDEAVFGGPGGQIITDVIAAGPGFVAVGIVDHSYVDWVGAWWEPASGQRNDLDAAVWTSKDGLTWQLVADPDGVFSGPGDGSAPEAGHERMDAIAIGEGRLVAVGRAHDDAAVWVSTDGLSWQRVPHDDAIFGGPSGQWMHDVVYTGERFVAVGTDVNGSMGDPGDLSARMTGAIWTSEDGLTWSRIANPAHLFGGDPDEENHMYISAVASTPDGVVAAGVAACVPRPLARCETAPADLPMPLWVSPDGLEWERIEDDTAPFAYLPTSAKTTENNTLLRHAPVRALAAFENGVISVGWDRGFAHVLLPETQVQFEHGFVPGQLFTEVAMTDVVAIGDQLVAVGYSRGDAAVWIGSLSK